MCLIASKLRVKISGGNPLSLFGIMDWFSECHVHSATGVCDRLLVLSDMICGVFKFLIGAPLTVNIKVLMKIS